MTKYHQVIDGEWIFPTMSKHKRGCCDCGLVHEVDYRLVKKAPGGVVIVSAKKLGLHIMTRSYRSDKLTKARRKQVKHKQPGVE